MADTAAFLAGCAVTGVAALFLLRNDLTMSQAMGQARGLTPLPAESATAQVPVQTQPSTGIFQDPTQQWKLQTQLEQQQGIARDLTGQFQQQQSATQDIKSQLEKQQDQSEDLRSQLEKQQRSTEQLIAQLQEQQRIIDKLADQRQIEPAALRQAALQPVEQPPAQFQTTFLWIAGGVLLVILVGGGLMLIGVIVFVITTSRRRQTRTVHVVHPVPTPYSFSDQPQLLQSSRTRIKPPRKVDYYDE
ncbi:MAG: hypothetical protein HC772_12120 [Leptolyngbyaceae cyanobacterium CRU_2_3]|nr:hypothetical protein [Leptolyngbyaceae cyanobacterium CRU_2_3]